MNLILGRPTEDQLTDFFTQVKDSHIKIVISLLEEQDLEYLIDGVVTTLQKDQISTTNGYTWIFDGSLSDPLLRNPFDTRNDKRVSHYFRISLFAGMRCRGSQLLHNQLLESEVSAL